MRKKQSELLQFLLDNKNWTTADTLSHNLNVSIRTIKSYIAEINFNYPGLISSSNRGYQVDQKQTLRVLKTKDGIPQDYDERCIYLIKRCLLNKSKTLNLFDLCDELFVSFSTLKNEISQMNTTFGGFNLSFSCSDNKFQIDGRESNKRRLVSHVMFEEVSGNFLDLSFLQDSFPKFNVEEISETINKILNKHRFYINDFSFINLLMHIMIIGARSKSNRKKLLIDNYYNREDSLDLSDVTQDICLFINDFFEIRCSHEDYSEIQILLQSNMDVNSRTIKKSLKSVIDSRILKITRNLITSVDEHYYINLKSEDFITPFALHLKNLQTRLSTNSVIKNPMWESLKLSCPTVYDIAAFMAYQLGIIFNKTISEDEIGFLALHIGTELERQKKDEEKVNCVVLCPNYLSIKDELSKKIIEEFSKRITIKKFISFENEIPENGIDLLITTIPVKPAKYRVDLLLAPFTASLDSAKINLTIGEIESRKKCKLLAENLDLYFNKELFIYSTSYSNQKDIIECLGNKLISMNYVTSTFIDEIWKREKASSTAFKNIAIPHPLKMSAFKTCIAIAIFPKGIEWNKGHIVNIVCMTAFNKMDNKNFHKLYEILIDLLNRPAFFSRIKDYSTFEKFKQGIIKEYRNK